MSKTCMRLENFKFHSGLHEPQTHFQQGHQQADAPIGFVIIIRNTTIVENGVEHQGTVNILKNLGNGLVVFGKNIKSFFITTVHERRLEYAKKEGKLHCFQ